MDFSDFLELWRGICGRVAGRLDATELSVVAGLLIRGLWSLELEEASDSLRSSLEHKLDAPSSISSSSGMEGSLSASWMSYSSPDELEASPAEPLFLLPFDSFVDDPVVGSG